MIPEFILVKKLGLINSWAAVILAGAINTFNLIIVMNFFRQLPNELEEAAHIDGASSIKILTKIILPLSKPVLATFTLFYAVMHWNSYFNYLLYINDSMKWNIQVLLRQIVMMASGVGDTDAVSGGETTVIPETGVKMATVIVSTVPIIIIYPFLQKYFARGVLLGSVKG